jgi:hypothetical protein
MAYGGGVWRRGLGGGVCVNTCACVCVWVLGRGYAVRPQDTGMTTASGPARGNAYAVC